MYIKFIKNHPVGISKGEVRNLQESNAEEMIVGGYAEVIEAKEYESLKAEMIKLKKEEQKKTDKQISDDKNKQDKEDSKRIKAHEKNKNSRFIATVKKEDATPKDNRVFHKITKGDLENNPDFISRHLDVGVEILLGEDANPIRSTDDGSYYGREGKIVGKYQPSSEDSTEDGEITTD